MDTIQHFPESDLPKASQRLANPWWAVAIVGVGFLLRTYRLGVESIWYDEGVSLYLAQQTPAGIIQHTAGDIHPPLYYLLLHLWIRLLGSSEFAAALLSVAFGLLIVTTLYYVGSRLYNRNVGTIAALLAAVAPFQIWYSQEIRMYTMGAFFGLLAFWGTWRFLQTSALQPQTATRCGWICYVIAGVLGLYTIYYFAFLLITLNVWAATHFARGWRADSKRVRALAASWVCAQIAILILYAPWLGTAVRQALNPPVPVWRSPVSLWEIIVDSWSALTFGQSVIPAQVSYALAFAAALYGLGAVVTYRRNANLSFGLVLYTVLPIALIALASWYTPLFHVRYVFTYSPALYLVLAAGIFWLCTRTPVAGIVALVIWLALTGYSLFEYQHNPRYRSDDFRGAVHELAAHVRSGDAILINAGYTYPPFVYYFPDELVWRGRLVDFDPATLPLTGTVVLQTGSIDGSSSLGWGRPDSDFYATTKAETAKSLQAVFDTRPRLWVLRAYDTVVDPDGFVRHWLDENGRRFEDQVFGGESYIRAQGYWTQKAPSFQHPPLDTNTGLLFDERLELLGFVGPLVSVHTGSALEIDLFWQAHQRLSDDYGVMLELVDGSNRIWARSDELLGGSAYPTSRWLAGEVLRQPVRIVVPEGTPLGTYRLVVTVYDTHKHETLSVTDFKHQAIEKEPVLGTVTVEGLS